MKKLVTTILIFIIGVFLLPSVSAAQTMWYVATTGSDPDGDGSIEKPFLTIQRGMDAANNGDTVIVMEGRYAGAGNSNLNFMGKAITVRSREPDDNECMRRTIIDAQGRGVIVRFINDEGSGSVFAGFTLIAGDTSVRVRGLAGFFEFSDNARPTTRRLRIAEDRSPHAKSQNFSTGAASLNARGQIASAGLAPPFDSRIWDGNNPFYQPFATTDYYGSGDVDADGVITSADVLLAQNMADGLMAPSPGADVDGNGVVDADDVSLISDAPGGGVLPARWNSLTDRKERNLWIDKILAIDQTDQHRWRRPWYVCNQFGEQLAIHATGYRGDLFWTIYDGGPPRFNVPMYVVTLRPPAHCINAVMVGDDPLNFDDWRFIEPQNDLDVHPGQWNMPYGATVTIEIISDMWFGACVPDCPETEKVHFFVDESGWRLEEYSSELVLNRFMPLPGIPDNRRDLWNPRIFPLESDLLLFDRARDDMSHTTDIHLADLDIPFVDPPAGTPLTLEMHYSRLLDIFRVPDGTVHLLWKGKPDSSPGIFHGRLDPLSRQVIDVTRVSTADRFVRMGRVLVTADGEIHVFWYELHSYPTYIYPWLYDPGIYWTRWTGSAWQTEQKLTARGDDEDPNWINRQFSRYFFDVAVSRGGNVILVWYERVFDRLVYELRRLQYDGDWSSSTISIEPWQNGVRGLDLAAGDDGVLHLAYWLGPEQDRLLEEGRGVLVHRTSDGVSWSDPQIVDESGGACCPRIAAGIGGDVYMVWERKEGQRVVPFWSKYRNGGWQSAQSLSVRPGADAWYPTVSLLSDSTVVSAWSSRSNDHVTIETEILDHALVEIVHVSSGQPYTLGRAKRGARHYIDQDYTITEISPLLDGGTLVQTADKDMDVDEEKHLVLHIAEDAAVFVCYDQRGADSLPLWLEDWERTEQQQVILGGNWCCGARRQSANDPPSHYIVYVDPDDAVDLLAPEDFTTGYLDVGSRYHLDRDNTTIKSQPAGFENYTAILTRQGYKTYKGEELIRLHLSSAATIYIAYDQRVISLPRWMDGFTPTGNKVEVYDDDSMGHFDLYEKYYTAGVETTGDYYFPQVWPPPEAGVARAVFRKDVLAGEQITLGGNHAGGNTGAEFNYFVVIKPLKRSVELLAPEDFAKGKLSVGSLYHLDRDNTTIKSQPQGFENYTAILTRQGYKTSTADEVIRLNLSSAATIYVAYDRRATNLPDWMVGFTPTGEIVEVDGDRMGYFNLYQRDYPAGLVVLGGNMCCGAGGAGSHYVVYID